MYMVRINKLLIAKLSKENINSFSERTLKSLGSGDFRPRIIHKMKMREKKNI
jgi:hypothetical protein